MWDLKGGNIINNLIFNQTSQQYFSKIYGETATQSMHFATDTQGRMILSPSLNEAITASNLNIRDLTAARDVATITASNLDIRNLTGLQDTVTNYGSAYATASTTSSIPILGTVNLLPRDLAPYSQNTFIAINNLGIAVTIQLQVAPVNIDAYYTDDGSSFNLLGNSRLVLVPSVLMRYARVRVNGVLSLGNVKDTISTTAPSGTNAYLVRDIGPYSQNSYFIRNNGASTITVSMQIAPSNDPNLYFTVAGPNAVTSSNNQVLSTTTAMRYARLLVQASANTAIVVYYNGRA